MSIAADAGAHAALARSDPPAGATLTEPPAEIRLWFTEPLEETYTGADLLDGNGNEVTGVTVTIASGSVLQLVMTPPSHLPDGAYTVAWQTLSAADGHTLQGYLGFRVGAGAAGETAFTATGAPGNETARALSRGLALLGLAAILAIAPTVVGVLGATVQATPSLANAVEAALRRYTLVAAAFAILASLAALAAQAAAIIPDASLPTAMARTVVETRYGQLWLVRLLLLLLAFAAVAAALWGTRARRRPALMAGTALAIALPLPFSLLSHAAAQDEGWAAAVAADALHLLAASLWAGGLFLLAVVLVPALRPLSAEERRAALRVAIPRFSAIALAAWGVLLLSGLYSAWLQVGTVQALRETLYGQTLLLKGALLLPVLALAAFHLALGLRGVRTGTGRVALTLGAEALLAVAILLVVSRLIGLEPAREVIASQTPSQLVVPVSFVTDDGQRTGRLAISPGAVGVNTFTVEIDGEALPEGSEAVLRFALPSQEMGAQELRLPRDGPYRFRSEGPELALPGDWSLEVIVRRIGAFTWRAEGTVAVAPTPPPAPEPNPAPRFQPAGIGGMIAITVGLAMLAAAIASRLVPAMRRGTIAVGGTAMVAGALILATAQISVTPTQPAPVLAGDLLAPVASPASQASHGGMTHHHATHSSARATLLPLPGPGTPVSEEGITVNIAMDPESSGPVDVTVDIAEVNAAPLSGARVVVVSDMPEMAMGRVETAAAEVEPGRYVAEAVPLGMPGEWRLAIRVSPKGESTRVFPFVVTVS